MQFSLSISFAELSSIVSLHISDDEEVRSCSQALTSTSYAEEEYEATVVYNTAEEQIKFINLVKQHKYLHFCLVDDREKGNQRKLSSLSFSTFSLIRIMSQ